MAGNGPRYDVAGLGNALVDTLLMVDDQQLAATSYQRGIMHLADHEEWERAFSRFGNPQAQVHAGGSAANTIAALGLLGARAVFRGQVGQDTMGERYADSLAQACGGHCLRIAPGLHTGKSLALVSRSDGERTMLTDLGAAPQLADLGRFHDQIRAARILHTTGYALLDGPIRQTALQALDVARQAGVRISLDVADPFVVGVIKDDLWRLLREYVDVAFMNHEEVVALCDGAAPEDAIHDVAEAVDTAVVKLGRKGSLVKRAGQVTPIGIHRVEAVDTTGAGDSYAAGFLYGMVNDWSPAACGRLGARVAALTVSQLGAVYRDVDGLKAAVQACKERS